MRKVSFGEKKHSFLNQFLSDLRARTVTSRLKNITNPKTALELGCGYNGYFLSHLISSLPSLDEAVGVDLSVNNNPPHPKMRLIQGDLNKKLPLPDGQFDIVFSTAVLEHLEDAGTALAEMHRVLKKGGSLFLTTPAPSAKPVLEFLSYKLGIIDEREIRDHKHYFSRDELRRLFAKLGYTHITVSPFQFGLNTVAVCKK